MRPKIRKFSLSLPSRARPPPLLLDLIVKYSTSDSIAMERLARLHINEVLIRSYIDPRSRISYKGCLQANSNSILLLISSDRSKVLTSVRRIRVCKLTFVSFIIHILINASYRDSFAFGYAYRYTARLKIY